MIGIVIGIRALALVLFSLRPETSGRVKFPKEFSDYTY